MPEGSLILSIGSYGGFYIRRHKTFRICLGWVALTVIPFDIDAVFHAGLAALTPAAQARE